MNTQLKDLSVVELKAHAFDSLVIIEQQQMNIKIINEELARRANETKPEVKTE
jgi:hypothetical protein